MADGPYDACISTCRCIHIPEYIYLPGGLILAGVALWAVLQLSLLRLPGEDSFYELERLNMALSATGMASPDVATVATCCHVAPPSSFPFPNPFASISLPLPATLPYLCIETGVSAAQLLAFQLRERPWSKWYTIYGTVDVCARTISMPFSQIRGGNTSSSPVVLAMGGMVEPV